ncbi:hypothetical protein OG21DRAFT_781446 [Imleria badia]|nr:hypothetical protein OG21DRAFT_781446 [Imleria badia]
MQIEIYHLFLLVIAGVGQALLLAFAWGFLGAVLLEEPLTLPYSVANYMYLRPSETTLVVTLIGTVLSLATTSCFALALKEALRHRMHKPISLIKLIGGITLARGEFVFSFQHLLTTLVTISMFALTKLMVSSWSTLLTPTLVALHIPSTSGSELNLDSSYFESQLGAQLVSSGNALGNGNSVEIIDTDGLLSGIATAQYSFGVSGVLNFNGVLYNVSTGGVLPAAPGFLGSSQPAQPNNTGLGFVGGFVPNHVQFPQSQAILSNYTIQQQGLTADVTCYQIPAQTVGIPQSSSLPVSIFNGTATELTAYAYTMACDQGESSQQDYVLRSSSSSASLVYSLVCPYPVGQSNLDWSTINVTSGGTGKYLFLQETTCEITPKLTTSLVTYANATLYATVINSTAMSSNNSNLSLFLASVIDYQSQNSQGLVANSIGDALYSIAVTTTTALDNGSPMDPRLIEELYWRGVIEFSGTYLRSGFSAQPITIPDDGMVSVTGHHTITIMGWSKRSPTYLYTVLPVTFFFLFTYAAIGYALWHMFVERHSKKKFATFDPTNPLHLIMVSSTRVSGEKEACNLEGERLGGFDSRGIQDNEDIRVQLEDVDSADGQLRKRFMNSTPASGNGNGFVPSSVVLCCRSLFFLVSSSFCVTFWCY